MTRFLASILALGTILTCGIGSAHAQFILPPTFPGGPTTVINPDRIFNPLSNMAIPGTQGAFNTFVPGVGWVSGTSYIGLDGKPHGTTVLPGGPGGGGAVIHYRTKTPSKVGNTAVGTPFSSKVTPNYNRSGYRPTSTYSRSTPISTKSFQTKSVPTNGYRR